MCPARDIDRWPGLDTIAVREQALLAPYAMRSVDSAGRKHAEPEHPYRGPYQRDRDRILHSSAFRRLSGKMQVFTGEMGDYHRTRLTHTMEVASIARTMGRALRLNEDLVEALALLHDIGHPPFGHAGEETLNECLADEGGFSHNRFALTMVEELEDRYHAFPGLNLTREVLEGQVARTDKSAGGRCLLEVQVVDVADSITYNAHDVDDAIKLGLVTLDELCEIPLAEHSSQRARRWGGEKNETMRRKLLVHDLIDCQVSDVLRTSGSFLATCDWGGAGEAKDSTFQLGPSQPMAARKAELETFLYRQVYRHPRLVGLRQRSQQQVRQMFHAYLDRPELLPLLFRKRADVVGTRRSVADHIAGMTDRFCVQQASGLFGGEKAD